jgi:hypothetical protein
MMRSRHERANAVGGRWLYGRREIFLPIAIGLITLALQAVTSGGVSWLALGIAVVAVVLAAVVVPGLAYVVTWFAAPHQMILETLARIEENVDPSRRKTVSPVAAVGFR